MSFAAAHSCQLPYSKAKLSENFSSLNISIVVKLFNVGIVIISADCFGSRAWFEQAYLTIMMQCADTDSSNVTHAFDSSHMHRQLLSDYLIPVDHRAASALIRLLMDKNVLLIDSVKKSE